MSANEWLDAITNAVNKKADKVPEGWKTPQEIREILNKSQRETSRKIAVLIKEGLVEVKKFRIETPRGLYPEIHYKLIKKK